MNQNDLNREMLHLTICGCSGTLITLVSGLRKSENKLVHIFSIMAEILIAAANLWVMCDIIRKHLKGKSE